MEMMVRDKHLYLQFAGLLEYPREDVKLRVEECLKAMGEHPNCPPEALEEMRKFQKDLEEMPLDDLQGVFSYTFELTSEYTLDMGSYLYEGFKRSNHLAAIKAMYREQGFPVDEVSKGELPDHLPIVLQFLAALKDEALKRDVLESFVVRAIEILNKNFARNRGNIYSHLINAIYKVLDKDVKEVK